MPYICGNVDCNIDIPRGQVKRCGRCRLATYCSKACQTAAWKAQHKRSCFLHEALAVGEDGKLTEPGPNTEAGQLIQLEKRLDRWLQHWRRILYSFTPFAQDLANHPDRPDSHYMVIWVKPSSDPPKRGDKDKLRDFTVQRAKMVSTTDLKRMIPESDRANLSIPDRGRLIWPDIVTFRIALIVNDPSQVPGRIMQHGFRDIEQWRLMDKRSSAINAALWEQTLVELVRDSTPEQAMDLLKRGTLSRMPLGPMF